MIQAVTKGLGGAGQGAVVTAIMGNADTQLELFLVPATSDFPFQTVFTVGLSRCAVSSQRRLFAELMMHLPFTWDLGHRFFQAPEYQWPIEWLRKTAAAIIDRSLVIPGKHVIIANDDPPKPLGAGTEQSCLLLLADFYDFSPVKVADGKEVHLYQMVPLYAEERDFERERGILPLLNAMARIPGSLAVHPDRERFV